MLVCSREQAWSVAALCSSVFLCLQSWSYAVTVHYLIAVYRLIAS